MSNDERVFGKNRPRDYIKAVDLNEGDKVLFVGGDWKKKDFSATQDGTNEKTVYVAKVAVNDGDVKELTINATSGNSLAEEWGEEGENWTGRIAKVSFVKMMSFGKMQNVLCLVPTDEKVDWDKEEG